MSQLELKASNMSLFRVRTCSWHIKEEGRRKIQAEKNSIWMKKEKEKWNK